MQITRRQLKFLIEAVLNEEGTDAKGFEPKKVKLPDVEKTDIGSTFMKQQLGQFGTDAEKRSSGADTQAITDFRKGSNRTDRRLVFGPNVDAEGNLEHNRFTTIEDFHEPDDDDIAAVERYKTQGGYIGEKEKSVDDPEITLSQWDDENTEETEVLDWGEEDTKPQYRWDKTDKDPGHTARADDDFHLDDEDIEVDEDSEDYEDEPDTEYGIPEEKGFFTNLKDRIFNMFKEERNISNISRSQLRRIIIAEIKRNNL